MRFKPEDLASSTEPSEESSRAIVMANGGDALPPSIVEFLVNSRVIAGVTVAGDTIDMDYPTKASIILSMLMLTARERSNGGSATLTLSKTAVCELGYEACEAGDYCSSKKQYRRAFVATSTAIQFHNYLENVLSEIVPIYIPAKTMHSFVVSMKIQEHAMMRASRNG